jgi:hypothetical protein
MTASCGPSGAEVGDMLSKLNTIAFSDLCFICFTYLASERKPFVSYIENLKYSPVYAIFVV